jgi:hypothetical protein
MSYTAMGEAVITSILQCPLLISKLPQKLDNSLSALGTGRVNTDQKP